jgi:dienelactone hydrolase
MGDVSRSEGRALGCSEKVRRILRGAVVSAALALPAACLLSPAAFGFDSEYESRNYAKIEERANSDYTPEFEAQLAQQGAENEAQGDEILAADGPQGAEGRDPTGNLCFHHTNGCAGDIRLYGWGAKDGVVYPVLFTQRNGATLSGHIWMTKAGAKRRPGVVITNGSIQAPEPLYWYAAETLAKDGYIVLTWDPQGQGYSDTYGEGVDKNDGVPSQSGQPFFFGTEDALDFFFSTPRHPYVPRPSCSTGTSHAAKQKARVAAGLDSAYNPFWSMLARTKVGLAGHSLGAAAVSYVGQLDPRVKAIVAWDNLSDVTSPGNLSNFGQTIECPSGSSKWPATLPVSKPAIGMSDDYGLAPTPFTEESQPEPASKNGASLALSAAGVDSGEISVRGGTHYEFSYIPNRGFGATHRGMDMADWYTLAWFDKYLKHSAGANARLTTQRWRADAGEQAVDDQIPSDGNMFSTYLTSRLDITLSARRGTHFDCENMRAGCTGMSTRDSWPANFSFLADALTPDSAATSGSTTAAAGATGVPPAP